MPFILWVRKTSTIRLPSQEKTKQKNRNKLHKCNAEVMRGKSHPRKIINSAKLRNISKITQYGAMIQWRLAELCKKIVDYVKSSPKTIKLYKKYWIVPYSTH